MPYGVASAIERHMGCIIMAAGVVCRRKHLRRDDDTIRSLIHRHGHLRWRYLQPPGDPPPSYTGWSSKPPIKNVPAVGMGIQLGRRKSGHYLNNPRSFEVYWGQTYLIWIAPPLNWELLADVQRKVDERGWWPHHNAIKQCDDCREIVVTEPSSACNWAYVGTGACLACPFPCGISLCGLCREQGHSAWNHRPTKFNKSERYDIMREDDFQCQLCGRSAPDVELHVDHLWPVSKGGSSVRSNGRTLCRDCNIGKGAKVPA